VCICAFVRVGVNVCICADVCLCGNFKDCMYLYEGRSNME